MKKILSVPSLLILISSLVGCQTGIISQKPEKPDLIINEPEPLKLDNVRWVILTQDNYQEIIEKAKDKNGFIFLLVIDEKGYKSLALNNTKVLNYLREQKAIIAAYKTYYNGKK